jgi:hypothetical protein
MRKMLRAALVAALLIVGTFGKRACAMTFIAPSALNGVAAELSIVQKATKVCGPYGCARVYRPFTYSPPYYGYYRPWGWSDVGHPAYYVPYYGFYRPWGWSDVGRWW